MSFPISSFYPSFDYELNNDQKAVIRSLRLQYDDVLCTINGAIYLLFDNDQLIINSCGEMTHHAHINGKFNIKHIDIDEAYELVAKHTRLKNFI